MKGTTKLNWWNITKKYWKETIFFYLLATLSFLGSWFIAQNALGLAYDAVKNTVEKQKMEFVINFGKNNQIYNFGENLKGFLIVMGILIVIYCAVVFAHVYYSFYFNNKVIYEVKKKLFRKISNLKNPDEKQNINSLLYDSRVFGDWVVYAPNQLYYIGLETIFAFWMISGSPSNVIWLALGYFFAVLAICGLFNFLLYKKDLKFQKQLEKQVKQEAIFVSSRDLIIKKNLTKSYFQKYKQTLKNTQRNANEEDLFYTSAFVVPSYSLIKYSKYFFYPFVNDKGDFIAFNVLTKLFDSVKKMIERVRNYTYYFSAKKRLNELLAKAERNDLQNNVLISEPITAINLKKISFGYQENKPVLKKLDLQFKKGVVNHLTGENGYGKSTIISLIMGLYQPNEGEILINNKHKLSKVNLIKWRAKIAYAEHENLIENGLSTGQKQLADLNKLFANSENKEVFIFDEADNALDENNQKEFRAKLDKISKGKLVILISH